MGVADFLAGGKMVSRAVAPADRATNLAIVAGASAA
jgi:hypothetical protein